MSYNIYMNVSARGFAIFSLFILIIVGLLVGGAEIYTQIYKFQTPTDTATSSAVANNIISGPALSSDEWKLYKNDQLNVQFEYPAAWGTATTSMYMSSVTQEGLDTDAVYGFPTTIKATNIIPVTYYITFGNAPCSSVDWCSVDITIFSFSTSTPYLLICPEGVCDYINQFDEEKYVKEHANVLENDIAWLCKDYYGPEGGSAIRECRTYYNNRSFNLSMGYRLDNFIYISKYRSISELVSAETPNINTETFSVNELRKYMSNPNDFKQMEAGYEHVLETIKFK